MRLEHGEIVHEVIEQFARDQSITAAALTIIGGADEKSWLVVGPGERREPPITKLEHVLNDVHEIAGNGTLFPDDDGNPFLHLHMACGRESSTVTGCARTGVKVWHVMEVIIFELLGTSGRRLPDSATGFKLLVP